MDRQQIDIVFAQLTGWLVEAVPNLIAAVVILIVGVLIARWASRFVRSLLERRPHVDATMTPVIVGVLRYLVLIITFVAVLGQLGVQIASVLAVLGAAGLAIGLALQGTLSNIAAGLMLLWLRPFRAGEMIEVGGNMAKVSEIGLFSTNLVTPDGLYRFVPNSELWNKPVLNYSRNTTRRIDLTIGIGYEDDIDTAKSALLDLAHSDPRVLSDPAPAVMVTALADSAVNLFLMAWSATSDFGVLKSDLTQGAKRALEAAGISIPFPQRVVHHINETTDRPQIPVEGKHASRDAT